MHATAYACSMLVLHYCLLLCAQGALQLVCWLLQLLQQAAVLLGQPQLLLTVSSGYEA
jgi:hypothetical protein